MSVPIVILGAGGFGRHVLSILTSSPFREQFHFVGFLDDGAVNNELIEKMHAPLLGNNDMLGELPPETQYIIGIGSGEVRRKLEIKACSAGLTAATIIHPDTSIAEDVSIGSGSVICAGTRITTNAVIGKHVHLNMNVTVGHDAVLEDFVTVFPQVAVGGASRLCEAATLGAGSCVNPALRVGKQSYVASGAVVVNDVADRSLVAGVPASFKKRY